MEIKFFCVTFWSYSAPNKREDHFLRITYIFEDSAGWWGRLKAFFSTKLKTLLTGETVLFVIDVFAMFRSKQKWDLFSAYIAQLQVETNDRYFAYGK